MKNRSEKNLGLKQKNVTFAEKKMNDLLTIKEAIKA